METALILGGTRGLGAQIAALHRQEGWDVLSVGRSGNDSTSICDLSSLSGPQGVESLLSRLNEREDKGMPPITRFLWVSGMLTQRDFSDLSAQDILHMVDINFRNPLLIAQWIWKQMQHHGLNSQFSVISSTTGLSDSPKSHETIYAATKAAQVSFTRALGKGLPTHSKLKVSLFCPGGMRTEFWAKNNMTAQTLETFLDPKFVAQKIMGQLIEQTSAYLEVVIPRQSSG